MVYRKKFYLQTQQELIQHYFLNGQNRSVIDALGNNTVANGFPLMAYGGLYRPKITADQIAPVFAIIHCPKDKKDLTNLDKEDLTNLTLYSLERLKELSILPPYGRNIENYQYYFVDKLHESFFMSLQDCLQKGFAEVTLEDKMTNETCQYISHDYKHIGPDNAKMDITFMPKFTQDNDPAGTPIVQPKILRAEKIDPN